MKIFFKLNNLGGGLGPKFILTDDFGLTNPYEFTREELLNGVEITVTPGSAFIYVQSTGTYCKDCCIPNVKKQYILPTTTTSTTTVPPNLIKLTPTNLDGFFGLSIERISGVNPDNLVFSMQLDRYSSLGCTGSSDSYSFNPSLDAEQSFDFDGTVSSNLNLSAKIVSLTVTGGNVITTSPQTITVNGTNYIIEGFNVCTTL